MEAIIERCCGLDVHRSRIMACVLVGAPGHRVKKENREFGTTASALAELFQWLMSLGVTHVVMESTGVYWKPVHAVLEGSAVVIVANARHVKQVPGRKTDVKDAEWLADLARHGLVRASFVPPKPIRDLRDVVRYRHKVAQSQAHERNRLIKVLETAGIKLSEVLSDVFGVTGRRLIRALLAGETAPDQVAALVTDGRLRKKLSAIQDAMVGELLPHQRLMVEMQLERVESHEADMTKLDAQIDTMLQPYRAEIDRVIAIPGIKQTSAAAIVSEIGPDMSVWETPDRLAAWAGVAPGNNESAGKRKKAGHRKGNVWLQTILVESAWAATHAKNSYYRAKFYKLKARRGHNKALMAIARKLLIAVWKVLGGETFKDLGAAYLDQIDPNRAVKAATRRLEALGFDVTLTKRADDSLETQQLAAGFS
jgi:transposase